MDPLVLPILDTTVSTLKWPAVYLRRLETKNNTGAAQKLKFRGGGGPPGHGCVLRSHVLHRNRMPTFIVFCLCAFL